MSPAPSTDHSRSVWPPQCCLHALSIPASSFLPWEFLRALLHHFQEAYPSLSWKCEHFPKPLQCTVLIPYHLGLTFRYGSPLHDQCHLVPAAKSFVGCLFWDLIPTDLHLLLLAVSLLNSPNLISSVQFSSVAPDSLRLHEPQHARPPCPSPTPGVHPNSCPLSR